MWVLTNLNTPPIGLTLKTKIDDSDGVKNEQEFKLIQDMIPKELRSCITYIQKLDYKYSSTKYEAISYILNLELKLRLKTKFKISYRNDNLAELELRYGV